METYRQFTFLSLLMIGASASMVLPMGVSWLEQQRPVSVVASNTETSVVASPAPVQASRVALEGIPRTISIPSLNLDVAVADGVYDPATALWSITEETAHFATITQPANNTSGNTFIYGHNSQRIFGNLPLLQPGATAIVTTDNGHRFEYVLSYTETVHPSNVSTLEYNGETPRLTLQTCTGLWNENRTMVYFDLVSAS